MWNGVLGGFGLDIQSKLLWDSNPLKFQDFDGLLRQPKGPQFFYYTSKNHLGNKFPLRPLQIPFKCLAKTKSEKHFSLNWLPINGYCNWVWCCILKQSCNVISRYFGLLSACSHFLMLYTPICWVCTTQSVYYYETGCFLPTALKKGHWPRDFKTDYRQTRCYVSQERNIVLHT